MSELQNKLAPSMLAIDFCHMEDELKIAVDAGNDSVRIIEVTCAGGGGGGGGGDISDLRAAVTTIQNQLKWKPI